MTDGQPATGNAQGTTDQEAMRDLATDHFPLRPANGWDRERRSVELKHPSATGWRWSPGSGPGSGPSF